MTPHPTEFELRRYADRGLNASDLLRIDDHLAACEICRDLAASLAGAERRVASAVAADRAAAQADVRWAAPSRQWTDLAAAAAVLAAVGGGWWIGLRGFAAPPAPTAHMASTATTPESSLTAEERATVDRAMATGDVPRASMLANLNPADGVLMGSPKPAATPLTIVRPLGTVVDQDQPVFGWTSGGGAAEYRVAIVDAMFNKVAESPWLPLATLWTPDRPLPRGATYTWQVTERASGRERTVPSPPQREARFQITSADEHHRLSNLRTRVTDPVALAVLLADAGLLDEASQALAASTSPAAARLATSLAALRR